MKLRITESQLERLRNSVREEQGSSPNRYNRVIKARFDNNGLTIDGHEIEDITTGEINLSFEIGIDARSWGIKGIDLGMIQGPSEIEAEATYYESDEEGDFNTKDVNIVIYIDWSTANVTTIEGHGLITIDDDVEITLRKTENGNFIASEINITAYTL